MRQMVTALVSVTFVLAACGGGGTGAPAGTAGVTEPTPAASATGDGASTVARAGRIAVVTTTTQTADFARAVGGERVAVSSIIKPNVDAHDLEPTPADLQALADAALVVKNGVGLEPWFDGALAASGSSAPVVDASEGVRLLTADDEHHDDDHGSGDDHRHGEFDPHIWFDPRNAAVMAANIAAGLTTVDPQGAEDYRANLAAYQAQLAELDASIERDLAQLTNRKLVTNHDAFGYYVVRYDLEFVGSVIPSFDSNTELSARELQDLVDTIRALGVKAVFTEQSLPPKTAAAVASEAGVELVSGDDALYGDSLGPPGSPAGTYLGMMRHNTDVIVAALR